MAGHFPTSAVTAVAKSATVAVRSVNSSTLGPVNANRRNPMESAPNRNNPVQSNQGTSRQTFNALLPEMLNNFFTRSCAFSKPVDRFSGSSTHRKRQFNEL